MSGIFGFINLDGRPASPESFQKMADEMSGWGPDGVGSILSGSAAFGHALLIVTHESRFEKMPIHDQDEGILFTAAARLDNRDELCDLFGIPHPERPVTSDGQLVFRAFKKWGTESCKHIFGDWSFSAWHIKEQRLFLARDHLGNTGLYYYFKPPLLVFASNIKAVLAHPKVPRELNEMHLAQRMVFDYSEKTWSQTYWTNVCFLPASNTLTFKDKSKQIEKYWRLDEAPSVRLGSDPEYLEGFLDHFRRAMRVRLNSIRPVGSTLSAGLDSSSVTALAAEELRKQNQPLIAYTSIPLYNAKEIFPGRMTDEWTLAHQVAICHKNIEHVPIRSDNITALDAIRKSLKITHEPQHAASNMNWIISIFENACSSNLGVMLTGQLGNGGVSWNGGSNYIFHLFINNQWSKGFQALEAWKESHGFSWLRTLKSQLLRPVLLPFLSELQHTIHYLTQKDPSYSFPQKAFIRRMCLKKAAVINIKASCTDPFTERLLLITRGGARVGGFWPLIGSFHRLDVRDPTADVRLLEYCMGVPNEQNTLAGGQRMLIRRSMKGILPDAVRWNSIRGRQAADAVFRLIDQQNDVDREIICLETLPEVTQYLDTEAIKRAWKTILLRNWKFMQVDALLRSINNAFFLISISEYRKQN